MVKFRRSRRCAGCCARKRKCDEARPACGLCTQRGIECVYSDELEVVFTRYNSSSATAGELSVTLAKQQQTGRQRFLPSPADLPQPCLAKARGLQIHGAFLCAYLPQTSAAASLSPALATGWLRSAYALSGTDQLLSDAFSALSIQCIRHRDDPAAEGRIQMLRRRVIHNLARRLGSEPQALKDTTLACVMMLNLIESQRADSKGAPGWLFHANGAAALIRTRGLKNSESIFGRELLLGSRLMSLVGAIGVRRADKQLHHLTAETSSDVRHDFDRLFAILNALPETLEALDTVVRLATARDFSQAIARAKALITMCHSLLDQLRQWRTLLDAHQAAAGNERLVWEEPSDLYRSLSVDSPSRIFPTYFCYVNVDIAQQILLDMTGKVFLWTVIFGMEGALTSMGAQHQPGSATPADPHECRIAATQVAQSLEYFIRPDMGLTAIDLFGFPVSFICRWLIERDFPERLWFPVIFARLRTIHPGYSEFLETAAGLNGDCDIFELLQ